MKCFYHTEQNAVGTCKSCGKGLCPTCAVDLEKGLACKDRCETEVRSLITLINHNLEISAKGVTLSRNVRNNTFIQGSWIGVVGVLFLLMDLLMKHPTYVIGALGVVFLAYSGFLFWRGMTFPK